MTKYTITGIVESIADVFTTPNGFTKRDFVADCKEPNNNYPNPLKFTLKKDRVAIADCLNVGDKVEVGFTVDGRKWEGPKGLQVFVDLTAWDVNVLAEAETSELPYTAEPTAAAPNAAPEAESTWAAFFAAWKKSQKGAPDENDATAACKFATGICGVTSGKEITPAGWAKAEAALADKYAKRPAPKAAPKPSVDEEALPF